MIAQTKNMCMKLFVRKITNILTKLFFFNKIKFVGNLWSTVLWLRSGSGGVPPTFLKSALWFFHRTLSKYDNNELIIIRKSTVIHFFNLVDNMNVNDNRKIKQIYKVKTKLNKT